jgi:hypothetical protein
MGCNRQGTSDHTVGSSLAFIPSQQDHDSPLCIQADKLYNTWGFPSAKSMGFLFLNTRVIQVLTSSTAEKTKTTQRYLLRQKRYVRVFLKINNLQDNGLTVEYWRFPSYCMAGWEPHTAHGSWISLAQEKTSIPFLLNVYHFYTIIKLKNC